MDHEHWFDRLHRTVSHEVSRRGSLGAALTLLTGRFLNPGVVAEAKGAKRRKKRRKRKKYQPPSCSGGACAGTWPGKQEDIRFCEGKCGRCRRAGLAFCIHGPDDEHPAIHATCCPDGQECLGGVCCDAGNTCETPGTERCLRPGETCCVSDGDGYCESGTRCCPGLGCCDERDTCCPGQGCLSCEPPLIPNPASCECEDPCGDSCTGDGKQCCNGFCIDTDFSRSHCGGCDRPCRGEFVDCCDGGCRDLRTDPNHCRICGQSRPGHLCCNRELYDPATHHCCPEGLGTCPNTLQCCIRPDGYPGCCLP